MIIRRIDLAAKRLRQFSEELHVGLLAVETMVAGAALFLEMFFTGAATKAVATAIKTGLLVVLTALLSGHLWWGIRTRERAKNFPFSKGDAESTIACLSTPLPTGSLKFLLNQDEIAKFIEIHNDIFRSSSFPLSSSRYTETSYVDRAIRAWQSMCPTSIALLYPPNALWYGFMRLSCEASSRTPLGTCCILPLTREGAERYKGGAITAYTLTQNDVSADVSVPHAVLILSVGLKPRWYISQDFLVKAVFEHLAQTVELSPNMQLLAPAGDRRRHRLLLQLGFQRTGTTAAGRAVMGRELGDTLVKKLQELKSTLKSSS